MALPYAERDASPGNEIRQSHAEHALVKDQKYAGVSQFIFAIAWID
jgi:hypothetical protein